MFSKDKLVYDPAATLSENDNIGAFLRDGAGNPLTSTLVAGKQALDVNVVNGPDDGHFKEDDAHTTGDVGSHVLSVRQDTLVASTSSDGDYASFKVNARGALWSVPVGTVADDAADDENPVKVGSKARIGALQAISADADRANLVSDRYRRVYVNNGSNVAMNNQAVTVDDTAALLIAASLSGRRSIIIQNVSNKAIFLGKDATVTSADGLRLAAGGTLTLEIGEDVPVYAVGDAAGSDIRVLELA